jgi:hypothetical protein
MASWISNPSPDWDSRYAPEHRKKSLCVGLLTFFLYQNFQKKPDNKTMRIRKGKVK